MIRAFILGAAGFWAAFFLLPLVPAQWLGVALVTIAGGSSGILVWLALGMSSPAMPKPPEPWTSERLREYDE